MTQTRNNEDYERWVFRMALSVAHELTHFFTGYITGDGRPITPNNVSVPGWPGGEAGRAWEIATFGGIVEFWSERTDPSQPGEPIIFEDFRRDTPGYCVSNSYVEKFARGGTCEMIETAIQPHCCIEHISDIVATQMYNFPFSNPEEHDQSPGRNFGLPAAKK